MSAAYRRMNSDLMIIMFVVFYSKEASHGEFGVVVSIVAKESKAF